MCTFIYVQVWTQIQASLCTEVWSAPLSESQSLIDSTLIKLTYDVFKQEARGHIWLLTAFVWVPTLISLIHPKSGAT